MTESVLTLRRNSSLASFRRPMTAPPLLPVIQFGALHADPCLKFNRFHDGPCPVLKRNGNCVSVKHRHPSSGVSGSPKPSP